MSGRGKMREKFATVKWSIEDVLALRPEWTKKKASEFLKDIEDKLEEAMVEEGWNVISYALDVVIPMRK
jgi:hypothetical protein